MNRNEYGKSRLREISALYLRSKIKGTIGDQDGKDIQKDEQTFRCQAKKSYGSHRISDVNWRCVGKFEYFCCNTGSKCFAGSQGGGNQ